jgi:geranylgeranyl reductase family protein
MAYTSDVVVVGAGPGGATAAGLLARAGLDVTLLDRSQFPRDKTCGDALTPRAVAVLSEMGLLDALRPDAISVDRIEVVGPAGGSLDIPLKSPPGVAEPCLIVRRNTLDDTIRRWAEKGGARFVAPARVDHVEGGADGACVFGRDNDGPTEWQARAAIIATGSDVGMLRRSGLLTQTPPVMLASRTYYEGSGPPVNRLQFRFDGLRLPAYGWLFPLPGNCWNVGALVYPPRREPAAAKHALDAFIAAPAVAAMLAGTRRTRKPEGYPLRGDFETAPTGGPSTLLIGDAAGLVNPLTGEGIDYALESACIAAELLESRLKNGRLPGETIAEYDDLLRRRYQRLFRFSRRAREFTLRPALLDRVIALGRRRSELATLLMEILQGPRDPSDSLSRTTILRMLATG